MWPFQRKWVSGGWAWVWQPGPVVCFQFLQDTSSLSSMLSPPSSHLPPWSPCQGGLCPLKPKAKINVPYSRFSFSGTLLQRNTQKCMHLHYIMHGKSSWGGVRWAGDKKERRKMCRGAAEGTKLRWFGIDTGQAFLDFLFHP